MAISNKFETLTIQASETLTNLTAGTGQIFKAIDTGGGIAASADGAIGILQYSGDNGGNITLGYSGIMKFTAGGAISAFAPVTVTTSGYFVAANSGDIMVGRAGDAAVASGAVGAGIFNFATPSYAVNCFAVY